MTISYLCVACPGRLLLNHHFLCFEVAYCLAQRAYRSQRGRLQDAWITRHCFRLGTRWTPALAFHAVCSQNVSIFDRFSCRILDHGQFDVMSFAYLIINLNSLWLVIRKLNSLTFNLFFFDCNYFQWIVCNLFQILIVPTEELWSSLLAFVSILLGNVRCILMNYFKRLSFSIYPGNSSYVSSGVSITIRYAILSWRLSLIRPH